MSLPTGQMYTQGHIYLNTWRKTHGHSHRLSIQSRKHLSILIFENGVVIYLALPLLQTNDGSVLLYNSNSKDDVCLKLTDII